MLEWLFSAAPHTSVNNGCSWETLSSDEWTSLRVLPNQVIQRSHRSFSFSCEKKNLYYWCQKTDHARPRRSSSHITHALSLTQLDSRHTTHTVIIIHGWWSWCCTLEPANVHEGTFARPTAAAVSSGGCCNTPPPTQTTTLRRSLPLTHHTHTCMYWMHTQVDLLMTPNDVLAGHPS